VALLAAGGTEIKYFLWFLDLNPLSRRSGAGAQDVQGAGARPLLSTNLLDLQKALPECYSLLHSLLHNRDPNPKQS